MQSIILTGVAGSSQPRVSKTLSRGNMPQGYKIYPVTFFVFLTLMDRPGYATFGLLLAAAVCYISVRRKAKRAPFPPGPTPKFLIGNMLDMPVKYAAEEYMQWNERYGGTSLGKSVHVPSALTSRFEGMYFMQARWALASLY